MASASCLTCALASSVRSAEFTLNLMSSPIAGICAVAAGCEVSKCRPRKRSGGVPAGGVSCWMIWSDEALPSAGWAAACFSVGWAVACFAAGLASSAQVTAVLAANARATTAGNTKPFIDNLPLNASPGAAWIYLDVNIFASNSPIGKGICRRPSDADHSLRGAYVCAGLARDGAEYGVARNHAAAGRVCRGGLELLRQHRQIGFGAFLL